MAQVVLLSTPLAQWPEAVVQLNFPHIQHEEAAGQPAAPPGDALCWVGYSSPLDCLERALQKPRFDDLAGVLERWRCAAESFLILRRHHPDRCRLLNLSLLTPDAISVLLGSLASEFQGGDDRELRHSLMRPELHPSALANLVISQRNDLVQLYAALEADADRFGRDPQSTLAIPACSDAALGVSLLQQWELHQHRSQPAFRGSQGRGPVDTVLLEEQDKELSRLRQRLERFEQDGVAVEEGRQLQQENARLRSLAEERLQGLQASQSQLQQQTRRAVEVAAELQEVLLEKDQVALQLKERDVQLQDARQFIQHLQDSSQRQEVGLEVLGRQFEQLEAERRRSQDEAVAQLSGELERVGAHRDQLEQEAVELRALAQERLQELEAARADSEQFRRREEQTVGQVRGELEQLSGQRDQLEQEAGQLRALAQERLQELEAARAESEQFRRREEQTVGQVRGELEQLSGQRDQLEQEVGQLRALAQERLQELEAARAESEQFRSREAEAVAQLSGELERVGAHRDQLEQEAVELRALAQERLQELDRVGGQRGQCEQEALHLQQVLAELRASTELLEIDRRRLEQERDQQRASAEERLLALEAARSQAEEQHGLHQEAADRASAELEQVKACCEQLEHEAHHRVQEMEELRQSAGQLASDRQVIEELLTQLRREVAEGQEALRAAETRGDDIQEENQLLELQLQQLHAELTERVKTELQSLIDQRDQLQVEAERLRSQNEELLQARLSAENRCEDVNEENAMLVLQFRQIQDELDRSYNTLVSVQESARQREIDTEALRNQLHQLQQQQVSSQATDDDSQQLRALADDHLNAMQAVEDNLRESEQEKELLQLQLREIQEVLTDTFQNLQQSQESGRQREANIIELQNQRDELTRDLQGLAEESRHLFLHSSLQGDLDRSRIRRILQLVRESMQA